MSPVLQLCVMCLLRINDYVAVACVTIMYDVLIQSCVTCLLRILSLGCCLPCYNNV